MRLEIRADEREILLRDLDEFEDHMNELYREQGATRDPYDPRHGHNFATIARAREQLHLKPPWHLEGARSELESLLTSFRAGSLRSLELGSERHFTWLDPPTTTDPGAADQHLDITSVCAALLERLRTTPDE